MLPGAVGEVVVDVEGVPVVPVRPEVAGALAPAPGVGVAPGVTVCAPAMPAVTSATLAARREMRFSSWFMVLLLMSWMEITTGSRQVFQATSGSDPLQPACLRPQTRGNSTGLHVDCLRRWSACRQARRLPHGGAADLAANDKDARWTTR